MTTVLGIYIALLLVGGVMGYMKVGSKVSLVTSLIFALALAIFGFTGIAHGFQVVLALLAGLLVVFIVRFVKTKKFMPAGLMVAVTGITLIVESILSR